VDPVISGVRSLEALARMNGANIFANDRELRGDLGWRSYILRKLTTASPRSSGSLDAFDVSGGAAEPRKLCDAEVAAYSQRECAGYSLGSGSRHTW
jgi:hypothetical protein